MRRGTQPLPRDGPEDDRKRGRCPLNVQLFVPPSDRSILPPSGRRLWLSLMLTAAAVVLCSQVYVSVVTDGFRLSAAPVIYPILLVRLTGGLRRPWAGVSVFVWVVAVRCAIAWAGGTPVLTALALEVHGGLFYLCYDALLCLVTPERRSASPLRLFLSFLLCDAASNLLDLAATRGRLSQLAASGLGDALGIAAGGLAVAFVRALAAAGVLWVLSLREQAMLHRQESARYQQLFVMASDLKTELYFLKKDAQDIEQVTLLAYRIYARLSEVPELKDLSALALSVARNMHEIKKDNLRIIRGLESEVEGAYSQREMQLKDLLEILAVSTHHLLGQQHRRIRLICRYDEDVTVREHYRLMSILKNLVTNAVEAIRSAQRGGTVQVDCRTEGTVLSVCVRDDGPGIPPRALPHLFQMGYSTKYDPNTGDINRGVGLPAVRAIAQELGGEAQVERQVTSGAAFRVRLPLEKLRGGCDEDLYH